MANNSPKRWTIADALETYSIRQWGAGYFGINENIRVILAGRIPENIEGRGLSYAMVHMLDLSVVLPTGGLAAFWLWRREAWGYPLAALFLVMSAISGCGILAAEPLAGAMGLPPIPGQSPLFAAWSLLSALAATVLLFHLKDKKAP